MTGFMDNPKVQQLKQDLLNLDPNDGNARVELNKRLIERYPFLEIKGWDSSESGDFNSTLLDDMPGGWKKTLGIPLCEELREELLKIDPSLLSTYRVSQVKEKLGTLRWYADGYSDQMRDILTKYKVISRFTCVVCGKINVPIFDDGWISPFCRECYISHRKTNWGNDLADENIESLIREEANLPRNTIVKTISPNGTVERKIDFSDTLRALGVNPDNLPTIEEIIEARREQEEGQD